MELDLLHSKISVFLTREFSSADWTLLKDVSRCCVTIVRTDYLLRFSAAQDKTDDVLGVAAAADPEIVADGEAATAKLRLRRRRRCRRPSNDNAATGNRRLPRFGDVDDADDATTKRRQSRADDDDEGWRGKTEPQNWDDRSYDEDVAGLRRLNGDGASLKGLALHDIALKEDDDNDKGDDVDRRDSIDDVSPRFIVNGDGGETSRCWMREEDDDVKLLCSPAVAVRRIDDDRRPRPPSETAKIYDEKDDDNDFDDNDDDESRDKDFVPGPNNGVGVGVGVEDEEEDDDDEEDSDFEMPTTPIEDEATKRKREQKTRRQKQRRYENRLLGMTSRTKKVYPSRFYRKVAGSATDYQCLAPGCGRVFRSAGGAHLHHMKVHRNQANKRTKIKDKKCHLCGEAYDSKGRLRWHLDLRHPETIPADSEFICHICGKILSSATTLKTHTRLKHEIKKINYFKYCRVCHVHIGKEEDVDEGGGGNDGGNNVVGAVNAIEDSAKRKDREAEEEEEEERPTYKASLLRHFMRHHPEELIPCEHAEDMNCREKFVQKSQMRSHVAADHRPENDKSGIPCPHCAKTLPTTKRLGFHIDASHPDKVAHLDFVCAWPGCGRGFSTHDNLKIHSDGHIRREKDKVNGSVPRKECKICGKRIAPTYVSSHMRSAHGPKPEPKNCPQCGTVCPSERALKSHLSKVHSGVVYTCDICSKTFHYKNGLEIHIQRAHEKKRHQCSECDKVYSGRKEMLVHYRAVHEGIRYPCRLCQREFLRGPDRNRHERTFHNVDKWGAENRQPPEAVADVDKWENRAIAAPPAQPMIQSSV